MRIVSIGLGLLVRVRVGVRVRVPVRVRPLVRKRSTLLECTAISPCSRTVKYFVSLPGVMKQLFVLKIKNSI